MIRRIRAGEWETLRTLRLAALADSPDAFVSTHAETRTRPDEFWIEWVDAVCEGDERATFVAVDDHDRFVGMASGFEHDGAVELAQMWVAPEARRSGVGRGLVAAVLEWAGDRDVCLGVADGNDAAERLYDVCGFELSGEVLPLFEGSDRCQRTMNYRRR